MAGENENPGAVVVRIVVEDQSGVTVNRLDDPDDFDRFDVRIVDVDEADARRSLASVAVLESGHAFVYPAGLFALAGARPDDERWISHFNAMAEFARSKGWVDDDGRLQAHVIWG